MRLHEGWLSRHAFSYRAEGRWADYGWDSLTSVLLMKHAVSHAMLS